jgi:hypothetical protein
MTAMSSDLKNVFRRNADKYQAELRLSPFNFPRCFRLGFIDLASYTGPVPTLEEGEELVSEWFSWVFAEVYPTWPLPASIRTQLADELRVKIENSRKKTTLGTNIDKYRQLCGWTIETLAEVMDMDRTSILDHINKNVRPRPDALKRYAESFSDKLGYLVTVADLEK